MMAPLASPRAGFILRGMTEPATILRYSLPARVLHWLLAALILCLLALGVAMADLPLSPRKFALYGLHKSLGIVALALVALRLLWRLYRAPPPLPAGMPLAERLGAGAGHALLYGLMFALPLSGWAMSSAAGFPVSVFGAFTLPDFVAADARLHANLRFFHAALAVLMMFTVAVHSMAVLRHQWVRRDALLSRMTF